MTATSSNILTLAATAESIGRCTLFKGVRPASLMRLAETARSIFLPRNGILYRQGELADDLFIVVRGQIGMFLPLPNGAKKIIVLAHSCDSVCEATAYLGVPHTATAVAKVDSHVLAISSEVLRQQAQQDADLACRLLVAMSNRVMGLISDIAGSSPRSSLQRLCLYLLQFRTDDGFSGYGLILPASKKDIAAKLNLAQASLSRAFRQLLEMNVIALTGREIRVLNVEALVALSHNNEEHGAD